MLEKKTISIDFSRGLDKKTDDLLVVPGTLTTLENGVFDSTNTISKGGGYAALDNFTALGTDAPETAKRLARRKDELLIETTSRLYGIVRGTTKGYVLRSGTGTFKRVSTTIRDVYTPTKTVATSATNSIAEFDFAASGNLSLWVWREVDDLVYATLYDETTGAAYFSRKVISADAETHPRVVATASQFVIFTSRTSGTSFGYYTIAYATPTTVSARTSLFADAATAGNARIEALYNSSDTRVYFAYRISPTGYRVGRTNAAALTVAASTTNTGATTAPDRGMAITWIDDTFNGGANYVYVVTANAASGLIVTRYIDDFSANAAVVVDAGTNIQRVTVIGKSASITAGTCDEILIAYETGDATTLNTNRRISIATVDSTPAVSVASAVLYRSVGLASQAFLGPDQNMYVVGTLYSALQPTLFLHGLGRQTNITSPLNDSGSLGTHARMLPGLTGKYRDTGTRGWGAQCHLPTAMRNVGGTDVVTLPVLKQGDVKLEAGNDITPSGVARVAINFGVSLKRPLQRTEHADAVIFAGACPLVYDGTEVVEAGFHAYPDSDVFAVVDNAAGSLSAGTYGYAVVYEYYDANGRRWQSAPSVAESVTLAASRNTSVTVPNDRLTRKTKAYAAVYRTEANGEIYYRVKTLNNVTTSDSQSFTDDVTDAALISNEPLYTIGGGLDAEVFPAHRVACIHQSRYFMAGLENPYRIRYTDILVRGYAPNTSEVYEFEVPSTHGEVTALASMDAKLIIFCERGIWLVYGEGPTTLGTLNAYSAPELIVPDMGCKIDSPDSVILTPDGLWFRSDSGLRLLTRSGAIARGEDQKFIGSEVDTLVDGLVAAIREPGKSLIRFYTGTIVLVYDYQWRQWSQFTNHVALDALPWVDSTVIHMRNTGGQPYQSGGSTHDGTAIALKAETGWLPLGGVAGFQRVYEFLCTGRMVAASNLRVEVGHDEDTAYTAPVSVDTSTIASAGGPVRIRHKVAKQKCSSIRFRVSESGGTGAGFTLKNFGLQVGVKRGAAKLSATRTI